MTYEDIHKRFAAAATLVLKDEHGEMKSFCREFGINYSNFAHSLKRSDARKIRVEWIASFCEKYNISAEWVLTGRGKALR